MIEQCDYYEEEKKFLLAPFPLVVFCKEEGHKISDANFCFRLLINDTRYSKKGASFEDLIFKDDEEIFQNFLEELSKTPKGIATVRLSMLAAGKTLPVEISAQEIPEGNGRRMISAAIRDVSQEEENYRKLSHDHLTGLPNRYLLFGQLGMLFRQRGGDWVAILFMDLDEFKTINDTYGHDLGDQVLKEIAERLKKSLRSEDLICRWGGDEFIMGLKINVDTAGIDSEFMELSARVVIADKVEKILNSIVQPIIAKDNNNKEHSIEISASIGITYCSRQKFLIGKTDIESLLKEADEAMYNTKANSETFGFYKQE